jgi:hypothetical protein
MQHITVALVLGIKRKRWAAHIGLAHLVSRCLRLIPPFCFDHSILMAPELLGDLPEYRSFVLRLNEVQHGWRYVD